MASIIFTKTSKIIKAFKENNPVVIDSPVEGIDVVELTFDENTRYAVVESNDKVSWCTSPDLASAVTMPSWVARRLLD